VGVLGRVGRYRTPSNLKSNRIRLLPAGPTPPVIDFLPMCCSGGVRQRRPGPKGSGAAWAFDESVNNYGIQISRYETAMLPASQNESLAR
jgi:hypothetical protein